MLQGDATSADYDAQILGESLPYRALRASRAMRISLEHGFTTLRDAAHDSFRRALDAGVPIVLGTDAGG